MLLRFLAMQILPCLQLPRYTGLGDVWPSASLTVHICQQGPSTQLQHGARQPQAGRVR